MTDLAQQLLEEEEGPSVRTVYVDTRGYYTILRGCVVDKRVAGAGLCDAAAEAQDAYDLQKARERAADLPGFNRCNDVRQAVLISMCFQLGTLANWPHFKAALAMNDYSGAAAAGIDSDWARETPLRAKREMQMLASGQWIKR